MSITQFMPNGTIHLHRNDLPEDVRLGPVVAVDTETMGLNPHRDRLCLVQLSGGDGHVHLVQLVPPQFGGRGFDCPNLKGLLADQAVVKLMHFARFDVAVLQHSLAITVSPVRCTKIAAKLVRTFTDRNRPEGPVQGAAGGRAVETAAEFGLGCRGADVGAGRLCGLRCAVSACLVGEVGSIADPGEPVGSRRGLFCVPSHPWAAGSAGL